MPVAIVGWWSRRGRCRAPGTGRRRRRAARARSSRGTRARRPPRPPRRVAVAQGRAPDAGAVEFVGHPRSLAGRAARRRYGAARDLRRAVHHRRGARGHRPERLAGARHRRVGRARARRPRGRSPPTARASSWRSATSRRASGRPSRSARPPAGRDVELREVDLASLASVRRFADGVLADHDRLDVLIANAGRHGRRRARPPTGSRRSSARTTSATSCS